MEQTAKKLEKVHGELTGLKNACIHSLRAFCVEMYMDSVCIHFAVLLIIFFRAF